MAASRLPAAVGTSRQAQPRAWLSSAAVFLSAFLLFQIQPLIARLILPWFGGAASVWTASMLFFQTALLGGYLYAHWLARRADGWLPPRLHLFLLAASLLLLPVVPAAHWKPHGDEEPVSRILFLLAFTIGLQFVLLASTSPLLQAIRARSNGGEIPYHWYALSNAGSLLGLLTYPLLVEPLLGTHTQAVVWSAAYTVYAALAGWVVAMRRPETAPATGAPPGRPASLRTQAAWIVFPALASTLLLAATAYISQYIVPLPLIWVLPLSAYLLSFVLCFGRASWYKPPLFARLSIVSLLGMAALLELPSLGFDVVLALAILTAGVFLVSVYCHGEVVLRRPDAGGLTRFYLCVAIGGALGGLLVGVVAPLALSLPIDFPLAIVACAVGAAFTEYRRGWIPRVASAAAFLVAVYVLVMYAGALAAGSIALKRNFYGTLRVTEEHPANYPELRERVLTHGIIRHGSQVLDPVLRRRPTMYFAIGSGVHLAVEHTRHSNQRVGIIGLGTGSLAAYGRPGDVYRFYELDPQVVEVATHLFTYLADSPARVEVALGDARLTLEREPPQNYDLLVLDAFASDNIPAHLLTREAMKLYLGHLRANGMLAFHVSSKALRLVPVVGAAAKEFQLAGLVVDTGDDPRNFRRSATWVLLARDPHAFMTTGAAGFWGKGVPPWTEPDIPAWTDDHSPVWRIMR